MKVSVAYAEAKKQIVVELDLETESTVEQAVGRSGILAKFPEIDLTRNKLGIFGKLAKPEQVLAEGDRVEIYRPALGKPPKKSRPAKSPAKKPAAAGGAPEDKAAKIAAIKAKAAAAKAKREAAAGGAAPGTGTPEPAPAAEGDAAADDKAAKMAAAKARAAAAKAKLAARKKAAAAAE